MNIRKFIQKGKKAIIAIALVLAVMMVLILTARFLVFELLNVNGHSMSPTIRHGDRILVNKLSYRHGLPKIGDIIAFNAADGRILIKRVVGLPGDLIEVRRGVLYRNSERVTEEPYVKLQPRSRRRRSYRQSKLQDKRLFVMGDNRVSSVDSKDFGPISYRDVIGKVVFAYFPPKRIKRLR